MKTKHTHKPLFNRTLLLLISIFLFCNPCYAEQKTEGSNNKTEGSHLSAEGSNLPAEGSHISAEGSHISAEGSAQFVDTPYADEQKVLFEFFLDEPAKIHSALYWLRSYMNTLTASPYDLAPEFMNIIVLIHGTEIVTLAKKNYEKYKNAVERMRYYEQLGVEFRVCGDAADDYGYAPGDFQDFVKIIPSAIVELAHWQTQGYALIRPLVFEKKFTIEEIR